MDEMVGELGMETTALLDILNTEADTRHAFEGYHA
jgi:hypothetical protein